MKSAGNILTKFLTFLFVLALLGAVGVLLSELNARTYKLTQEGGILRVMKGRLLPLGTEPYRPGLPALAEAYAPVDLKNHSPGNLTELQFKERDELDRALFGLLESIARPLVMSEKPADLEQGLALLHRMDKLPGLSDEQRQALKALQSEVAFYQARVLLDDARKQIGEALLELKLAGDSQGHNARSANQMLTTVEAPAKALEEALRLAVHSVSAPATSPSSPQ